MSTSSVDFYSTLAPFANFSDLTNSKHYRRVPDDWWVITTDVKGSTEALANNRYRDVNLLGASSIIAVINTLKGQEVPFVFGGDGATLLVHEKDVERVKPALLGTMKLARDVLDFELRVGLVPIKFITAAGFSIEVAKFSVSRQTSIATLKGDGLDYAERMLKSREADGRRFRLEFGGAIEPDVTSFEGLSCRWNPIKAKRGEIMSLMVVAIRREDSEATYRRLIQRIESILSEKESHPASYGKVDRAIGFRRLLKEMRIHTIGQSAPQKARRLWKILVEVAIMRIFMITGLKTKRFSAETYIREMGENTDFQKFDDMIRMVRDCSFAQRDQILSMLREERAHQQIAYGVHMSNEALMTCLVFQLDNHIHFVDGSQGGYALAAKQLKEQLKETPKS